MRFMLDTHLRKRKSVTFNMISFCWNFQLLNLWWRSMKHTPITLMFLCHFIYLLQGNKHIKHSDPLKSLTESLDIWIFNIALFSCIVFSNVKSSKDQRQTVASWLDDTKTSLTWLTCKPVTGPRWWSILVICKMKFIYYKHIIYS